MVHKQYLLDFLEDLKLNNNKDWFQANQDRYKIFKENYLELTKEILTELSTKDTRLQNLEPKKCMFRINRDIRFSKDKSPYKTNVGMWFSTSSNHKNAPGYYVHIDSNQCFIAGGVYCPETDELKKIRNEIAFFHEDLQSILKEKKFVSNFKELDFDEKNTLKTAPKGIEKDHPALEYLKLKSYTATKNFSVKEFLNNDFVKNTSQSLLVLKPMNDFLSRALFE